MTRSLIGRRLLRKEDRRLLIGRGRFSADVSSVGQLYAAFLRSENAHADILKIDTSTARLQPGVMAALTGSDYVSDGNSSLVHVRNLPDHLDLKRLAFTDK
jgi:carbon-monoxide dehydrogenase large subunit